MLFQYIIISTRIFSFGSLWRNLHNTCTHLIVRTIYKFCWRTFGAYYCLLLMIVAGFCDKVVGNASFSFQQAPLSFASINHHKLSLRRNLGKVLFGPFHVWVKELYERASWATMAFTKRHVNCDVNTVEFNTLRATLQLEAGPIPLRPMA